MAGTSWWPHTIQTGTEEGEGTELQSWGQRGLLRTGTSWHRAVGCMHMLSSLPGDSEDAVEGSVAGRSRSGEATSLIFSFCHTSLTHLKASLRSTVAQGLESSSECGLWLTGH